MRSLPKIGENFLRFFLVFAIFFPRISLAMAIEAVPSSTEITEDENVSIEFRIAAQGMSSSIDAPKYEAPDFDEVNVYSRSQSMETRFINGKLTVSRTQSIAVVLHPKKAGRLKISNIRVAIEGKIEKAPDIEIEVHPSGTRLANRGSGYGGLSRQSQLPGAGARAQGAQSGTFFLKTEPSKLKVYKGEQIILTYALYTRAQILNVQVERYPTVSGFLKEDMDVPLLRGKLDYAPSVVEGKEYRRAVLAQYAVYPLKEGRLAIDPFTGKFSFHAGARVQDPDEDDPFSMFGQFFQALQTTTASRSSDRVEIEVLPLPAGGQPQGFAGLVGDFDITAVVDKYTVKAGESVNVKVKVEGKGHAGSLETLGIQWPADFELYENKSHTQFLKTGHTERLFEYMVIPRVKGKFTIPGIEISMFNPDSKSYQTRKTEPISIEVLEGSTENIYIAKGKPGQPSAEPREDIRYWLDSVPERGKGPLGALAAGAAAASMALALLGMWALRGSEAQMSEGAKRQAMQALVAKAKGLAQSAAAPAQILGEVEGILAQALEHNYGLLIGSLTRCEIRQVLIERSKDENLARRVESLLELCENSRFVPGGGDRQSALQASEELARLVDRLSLS